MAKISVKLDSVAITNLGTPTLWVSTHEMSTQAVELRHDTQKTLMCNPDANKITARNWIPITAEGFGNPAAPPTETTATHTFSIVNNGFVVATFTAVGTSVSPPRGVPQPATILPPWEVTMIIISAALFCFVLIRTLWHYRRFEMMMSKKTETETSHVSEIQEKEMDDICTQARETKTIRENTTAIDNVGKAASVSKSEEQKTLS